MIMQYLIKLKEHMDEQMGGAQKPVSGYGKRPMWQWVLMYVVVGGIVYGLVYYYFFAGSGYSY